MNTNIGRLLHGDCPPSMRADIAAALTAARPHQSAARHGSITQLGRLAGALPGIREQHANVDMLAHLLARTAVADPSLAMSAILHYALCGGTITNLAAPEQARHHLDALDAGTTKGVYLITEIGTSGSLTGAHTHAVYQPGQREFVLTTPDPSGLKFSSVSPDGGPVIAIVFARLVHGHDRGVYPFVVPLTDATGPRPGVEISSPVTISSLPLRYGVIRLRNVRIPYGNWLPGQGRIEADGTFHDPTPTDARLTRSLAAGGAALYATLPTVMATVSRTAAVRAIRYSEHRTTQSRLAVGSPLLAHQPQQISLFGAFADAMALTAVARQARHAFTQEGAEDRAMRFGPWTSVHPDLPLYKAITADGAARITRECRERCGLHGVLDVNLLTSYQGLAEAFVTAGGDNRLILIDTGIALAEADTPLQQAPAPGPDVTSPAWWPTVCRAHRAATLKALRTRLRRTDGGDMTRWAPLLEDARLLGQAHAHHRAAEALAHLTDSVTDPTLRSALGALAGLHGVLQARRLAAPLTASGTLTPAAVRRLLPAAAALCAQLVPQLPVLYDLGELDAPSTTPLGATDYATALTSTFTSWTRGGPA